VDDANTNDPYVVLPDQLQALLSSAIRHKIQATNATVRLYQAGDVPVEEIDFVVSSGPSLRKPSLNAFSLFRYASPTHTTVCGELFEGRGVGGRAIQAEDRDDPSVDPPSDLDQGLHGAERVVAARGFRGALP